MKPPVLIQAELVGTPEQPLRPELLPALAELHQNGLPLLLVAARPDRWAPTRNRVDRAFMHQATIEAELRRAGGALDAMMYLDLGLFSRRKQHELDLADIANRYGCQLAELRLLARPGKLFDALSPLVGQATIVDEGKDLARAIRGLVDGA
ncbi:MAG: hypothetical protein CVV18_00480 [Gammaproteobacteria bacterium HGW-Gammaproteobacteria-8]|nr:MAG: hypothetical protein CVV18_00480 [Gammaproteobacteria bacterium HGW-Gammaproteobacteria-8]